MSSRTDGTLASRISAEIEAQERALSARVPADQYWTGRLDGLEWALVVASTHEDAVLTAIIDELEDALRDATKRQRQQRADSAVSESYWAGNEDALIEFQTRLKVWSGRCNEDLLGVAIQEPRVDVTQAEVKTWTPEGATTIEEAISLAVGSASMCWEAPGRAGVYQSEEAAAIVAGLKDWLFHYVTYKDVMGQVYADGFRAAHHDWSVAVDEVLTYLDKYVYANREICEDPNGYWAGYYAGKVRAARDLLPMLEAKVESLHAVEPLGKQGCEVDSEGSCACDVAEPVAEEPQQGRADLKTWRVVFHTGPAKFVQAQRTGISADGNWLNFWDDQVTGNYPITGIALSQVREYGLVTE